MNINFLNQINLGNFFETSYIFESTPEAQGLYVYLGLVFGVAIVVALILIVKSKEKEEVFKKFYSKIINLLLFCGLVGLVLIFFRWQGIPYLGSRLLMFVLFAVAIFWAVFILWYKFKVLPKKIEEIERRKIFEKYLP